MKSSSPAAPSTSPAFCIVYFCLPRRASCSSVIRSLRFVIRLHHDTKAVPAPLPWTKFDSSHAETQRARRGPSAPLRETLPSTVVRRSAGLRLLGGTLLEGSERFRRRHEVHAVQRAPDVGHRPFARKAPAHVEGVDLGRVAARVRSLQQEHDVSVPGRLLPGDDEPALVRDLRRLRRGQVLPPLREQVDQLVGAVLPAVRELQAGTAVRLVEAVRDVEVAEGGLASLERLPRRGTLHDRELPRLRVAPARRYAEGLPVFLER